MESKGYFVSVHVCCGRRLKTDLHISSSELVIYGYKPTQTDKLQSISSLCQFIITSTDETNLSAFCFNRSSKMRISLYESRDAVGEKAFPRAIRAQLQ